MLTKENITALRMQRQFLTVPAGPSDYDRLFRDLSPVFPVYWCCPGDPPVLYFRGAFDDSAYNQERRAKQIIVKGRFQNGSIAYIEKNELDLFSPLYRKKLKQMTPIQQLLLELIEREGPMTIRVMKEMTGLLVKEITPALHKLQQAFLVFEDQVDSEGDRGWYLFEHAFPEIDLNRFNREDALQIILVRFAERAVHVTIQMAASFYKLPAKELKLAADALIETGTFVKYENGYLLASDFSLLQDNEFEPVHNVYILHRNDFLVKANEHWLKDVFCHAEYDTLQYILIDGVFSGAVLGHFKNGPSLLEDIVLQIPEEEARLRKEEIISALYRVHNKDMSPLNRYNGERL